MDFPSEGANGMAVDTSAAPIPAATRHLRRQAVRGGTLLLAARFGTQLFQWSVTLFVTRLLLPGDYGTMTAGVLFVGLADMLAEAGIGKALVQKKELARADLAQAFTLGLLLSVALYAGLFVLAGPAAAFQHEPGFAAFLRVLGLLLFLVPFRAVSGALLERHLQLGRQSLVQLGGAVAQAVLVLALALAGMGYWALAAGTLAGRTIEAGCTWYAAWWRPELAWPARQAWGLLRYGLHISGASLLWFVYNNSDFAAVNTFCGTVVLGYYAVAFQLMTMPTQKLSAHVNHILFAVFCKLQDDRARVRNWFLRLNVLLTFVIAPVLVGLALVANDGIPLLLGGRWSAAILPFQLLCPVGVIVVVSSALHQTLAALGRPDITLKFNITCVALYPAAFFLTAWQFGPIGVCLAWLVLTPLLVVVLLHTTRHITGIGVRDVVATQLPVFIGVAFMTVCVFAVKGMLRDEPGSSRLMLTIGTGVVAYTGWMLLTTRRTVLADVRGLWRELRGRDRDPPAAAALHSYRVPSHPSWIKRSSMKVVIIDGDVSYPATSGKRLRTLHLMLRAAERHQITYIGRCAAASEEARTAPAFLREHGIEPILVHHPVPQKSGPAFLARLATNALFSSRPYSVGSHHSEPMRQALRDYASRGAPDVWQFEWAPYLDLLDADVPGSRLVIAHNVDTLIWRRYYETARGVLKRAFLKQQWRRFDRFEQEAFRRADRVVAVSADDARLIRDQFGQGAVDVVDNGIDRAYFERAPRATRDPRRILFLGALDWRPNLDAIELLLGTIYPRVRSHEPNARLLIVGRNPSAGLAQRVRETPGVELHADVADVRPFLVECGVMAVPLRIGGGSRLKILEALACGLPVVSTRVGAEGLCLAAGTDYVQADEAEMADALVRAIRDPRTAQAQAEHGRRLVLETYDWDVLARKLEASWERCPGRPVTVR
jgi:O-antigen/teichoic acid export membrane protein/glycosyltransferase involved in cell wall biosynthesis